MDLAPQSVSVGNPFFEGCGQQLHEIKILASRNRKNPIAGYLAGSPYFCQFDRQLRMPQRHMFGYQFDVVKAYVDFIWLYMILWMPLMEDVFILPPWHLTSHTVQRRRSSSKHVQTNKGLTVEHPNLHNIFTYICSILYVYIYLFDIVVFSRIQSHSSPPRFFRKALRWKTSPRSVRNLAICGAVILVVIFALVPNPRIAIWAPWRREVHLVHGDAGGGWGWGWWWKGIPTWEPCVFIPMLMVYCNLASHCLHIITQCKC